MNIPEAIQALLDARGWRPEDLAAAMIRGRSTIMYWKSGKFAPNREACEKLAALCEGALSEFFRQRAGIAVNKVAARVPSTDSQRTIAIREAVQLILERGSNDVLKNVAGQLTLLAASLPQTDREKNLLGTTQAMGYNATLTEDKVKGNVKVPFQIAQEHEPWFQKLQRILTSSDKGAIRSIQMNLDTFERLAVITDKRRDKEAESAPRRRA